MTRESYLSHVKRKHVFWFSDHVWHKLGCTTIKDSKRFEFFFVLLCSENKVADLLHICKKQVFSCGGSFYDWSVVSVADNITSLWRLIVN